MEREEFIKNIKLPVFGDIDGKPLDFTILQESVMKNFMFTENFLVLSPRQTGRATSIFVNLLFELTRPDFKETILVGHSYNEYEFSRLTELSDFNKTSVKKENLEKLSFRTIGSAYNMSLEERYGKRIILFDAAFVPDKFLIYKLINGFDTVIMESVAGRLDSFNSLFIKSLVTNSIKEFSIIKLSYQKLGLSEEWCNRQRDSLSSPEVFNREVLLEWN